MFVAISLIKDSKRDFLENNKGEVTGPKGIESSSACSTKALEEGSSGAVTDGTVMVAVAVMIVVDGADRAAGVGADIALDRGAVTIAVDGTGRAAGGSGGTALGKLLKAILGKSSSSIIKSLSTSLSSTLPLWWTL